MTKTACTVPITQIILDEDIYPREGVSPKRVSMFAENMRDGFEIDPIEVQIHPDYIDKYRKELGSNWGQTLTISFSFF